MVLIHWTDLGIKGINAIFLVSFIASGLYISLTNYVYSNRLCFGLWQQKLAKWLAIICAVTYIAVFLTVTFGCWPYVSTIYHFCHICEAHLPVAFQTTGGSTLPHLVRYDLI